MHAISLYHDDILTVLIYHKNPNSVSAKPAVLSFRPFADVKHVLHFRFQIKPAYLAPNRLRSDFRQKPCV